MSAALLDEYNLESLHNSNNQDVLKERTRILETVSRKAQERTLTLKETTDLYAKFNSTYESSYKKQNHADDESWALKLLQECEEDVSSGEFETRINGVPLENSDIRKPVIQQTKEATNASSKLKDDAITVEDKLCLKDSFIYEQFQTNHVSSNNRSQQKTHQSLVTILAISVVATLSGLIGISLFL